MDAIEEADTDRDAVNSTLSQKIHENYKKVVNHLIEEKYAADHESADKIIAGMTQEWFDTIIG